MKTMKKASDAEPVSTAERRHFRLFCIITAAYFAVCALIFVITDIGEQSAYIDVKPILSEKNTVPDDEKININTASIEELTSLNGIGEVTAARIIEYRDTYGGFLSTDELINVSGIGEKLLKKISPYITI